MALTQIDQGLLSSTAQYTGFKNRIINGGFQIWQRGTSFTATGYGADRFIFSVGGTATFTRSSTPTSPNGNYYAIVTTGAASSFGNFTQCIETANVLALRGKTVTATAWVQGTGVAHSSSMVFVITYSNLSDAAASQGTTVTQTVTVSVAPTSTWQQAKATFVVPSDAIGLAVSLNNGTVQASGVVVSVADFQLEIGSTATSFDYRPYGTELQLCYRYYYRETYTVASTIQHMYGVGYMFSSAQLEFVYSYPVEMRAAPTFGSSAVSTFILRTGGQAISSISNYGVSTRSCLVYTANTANTANVPNSLSTLTTNGSVSYLEFIAEL
jgi:hypothetical protein